MNILNELNEACNYIENNIENEIDIKEIARITNQSTDSINRFFVSMLGITIKEYIRKRRLSLAVYDLQNSDEKITDIAFKYGFNSYDSFCKAFLISIMLHLHKLKIQAVRLIFSLRQPLKLTLMVRKK